MIRLELGSKTIELNVPKLTGGAVLGFVAFVAVVAGVLTSWYTVKTDEAGIVVRFGKILKTAPPGLHFKAPYGIDQVLKVAVKRQQKQEFGFGTEGASNPSQYSNSNEMEAEKQMVSGDLNAALVEWVIQYRITEPTDYLFKVRHADLTLRDASESVMREVVGDRTVDEVITVGRQEIEDECEIKLRELVTTYQLGMTIDQVQLKDVNPPQPVQNSFNEVNQAQQEKEKLINIANGSYNREVPKERGEAERTISEAAGYALQRVNEAEGDAARFVALFTEYQKAPEVTKRRIYLETMQAVMPTIGKRIIIDEETQGVLPLLNLDQQLTK
ncbi:MAG: FtsH protease activity modulator HflK [Verrucomicrobia bacterium]|nr:FtsH protease activity modulator HflK [Verrucomicrobiota bacterium]MDA1006150.1 FtsH protease activity modulator HflK [Verrucomicrobiota bacterium]